MKILRLAALPVCLLVLAGCGVMEGKRVDYKSGALKVPSLEVPPDLTTPGVEDRYAIPGGEAVASYSEFAKGGARQPEAASGSVLPEMKKVRMERSGSQRWLVVEGKAENLWPVIREFWQESGFDIRTDNPQAGVMETEWAENRATNSLSLDIIFPPGERDRYRTRLERGKDGNTTEIYISHQGIQAPNADSKNPKWKLRANDPELEAVMMQMLMARLSGAEAQPSIPGAEVKQESAAAPKLQELAAGDKTILLSEPFDRSWRKVGLALDRAGIAVEDRDRASGVYFLAVAEAAKDKAASGKPVHYQVTVRESGSGCVVSVVAADGAKNQETQRLTDLLYQNLDK